MLARTISFDQEFLTRFEETLNPSNPEHSPIPAQVLGYGEMSTVMTISGANPDLVFKRMAMFRDQNELEPYMYLYHEYLHHIEATGVPVVPSAITSIALEQGNIVVYIIQRKLDRRRLLNTLLHESPQDEIESLFSAVLDNIGRVFAYNDAHDGQVAIGLDGQISNWAVSGEEFGLSGRLPERPELVYVDTSTPLLQINEQELCEPELFLRSAPSFMRWVIRLLFLEDVMARYYNRRQVVIDALANLYKEGRGDMIPALLDIANRFLAAQPLEGHYQPISQDEVAKYYKEDARIWTVYLALRRIDRWLHTLLGRPYPYILPGPIER